MVGKFSPVMSDAYVADIMKKELDSDFRYIQVQSNLDHEYELYYVYIYGSH